ncbi:MAG: hypothetical protein K8T89_20465 [Planctomycetes bacterium]|nr:hypothetical protein [Planctomycetota bacterium]
MNLDPLDELLQAPAFAAGQQVAAFQPAVESCLARLRAAFPRYVEFLERGNSANGTLNSIRPLFLPILKSVDFPLPEDMPIVVRLTSSGTTGQPSVTPLDEPSWRRRLQAMRGSYETLNLFTAKVDALAFLMDPATTKMAGSLVIDAVLKQMPQIRSVTYLAKLGAKGPEFQAASAGAALAQAIERGPVVLVGYPALIAAAIMGLRQAGKSRFPLPEGSTILTGGGWKSFLPGVALDREEFQAQASAFFGVPRNGIRDMYGLSECPAVFVQCERGQYHVPAWALAQAVDPETGHDVRPGEVGLLQLTVPLTTSYPLLKILTTDKASVQDGCECGLPAPYLTPRGRVTVARYETCAMKIGQAVARPEIRG